MIYLGLVKVRNRLEIRQPIPAFYKKTLVVFEPVGSSGNGVDVLIGVVIFEHFARTLFEIRRCHDAQICVRSEPDARDGSVGRLHDDGEDRIARIEHVGQHDLALPPRSVFGNHAANGFIPPFIAARSLKNAGDIFRHGADAERSRQHLP